MCALNSVASPLAGVLDRADAPIVLRRGDAIFMNDDVGERILQELRETKSDVKTFALSLNAMNTEVARMSVKVEHLSNLQQTAVEHDRRIARMEAEIANHDKNSQRIGELYRWIVGLAIMGVISLMGLALQVFRAVPPR